MSDSDSESVFNPIVFDYSKLFNKSHKIMYLKLFVSDPMLKQKYVESALEHNNNIMTSNYPDSGFDLFSPESVNCSCDKLVKINFGLKASANNIFASRNNYPSGFCLYARSSLGSKTKLRLANNVGIIDSGYRGDLIGCFDCLKDHAKYTGDSGSQAYAIGSKSCYSQGVSQHSVLVGSNSGISQHSVLVGSTSGISQHSVLVGSTSGISQHSVLVGSTSGISQAAASVSGRTGYSQPQSTHTYTIIHDYQVEKYDKLIQICSADLSPIYVEIVDTEEELGDSERGSGGFGSTGR